MEVLEVLRKMRASDFETISQIQRDAQASHVFAGARQTYAEFVSELLKTPEIEIMSDGLNVDITKMLSQALEILADLKGRIRMYSECNRCGGTRNGERFISVHKCAGTADIIHLLLAKAMKCHSFITFDKGFLELVNDSRIKPLRIIVLGGTMTRNYR